MYEVWTKHNNGELGVLVCISTKVGCKKYINQAVRKGANPDNFIVREA